jgi:myosin-crossreactive antigen
MGLNETDIQDVKLAKPIALVDLWDIDDRINRLENCVERLEKCIEALVLLHKEERVKNWELILKEMLEREGVKKGGKTFIEPIFKLDTSEVCPSEFEELE